MSLNTIIPGQGSLQLFFFLGQLDLQFLNLRLELSNLVLQVCRLSIQLAFCLLQLLTRFLFLLQTLCRNTNI